MATCEWKGCTRVAEKNIAFAFGGITEAPKLCDHHMDEADRLVKEGRYSKLRNALSLPPDGTDTAHESAEDGS